MTTKYGKSQITIRLAVVALFASVSFAGIVFPLMTATGEAAAPTPTPRRQSRVNPKTTPKPKATPAAKPTPTPDPELARFAKFKHQIHLDMEIGCGQCHKVPTANWDEVRDKETAFPDVTDFPKHDSCIECHREQFFSGKPPAICSSCHLNPGPGDSTRLPFPNPREIFDTTPRGKTSVSEFKVEFPHDKHVEIVSRNGRPDPFRGGLFVNARMSSNEDSCKVCHSTYKPQGKETDEYFSTPPKDLGDRFWLKKGTFKASPIGHTTCFTCHSADTGIAPAPTDCGTCHKPKEALPATDFSADLAKKIGVDDKIMLLAWQRRASAATFRHEWDSHVDLSCSTCHNVMTLKTSVIKSKKVAVTSCMPCHITATVGDGGVLNAEIESRRKDAKFSCAKCHVSFGSMPIPQSHVQAIVEAGK